ncbi:MAG: hypothetical protein ACJ8AH_05980 [Stellaceae bacterium]|jgi:hypothetical protein
MTEPFMHAAARLIQHPEIAARRKRCGRLADIPTALPHTHRPLIANALLNRSVNHILAEERSAATAPILQRLVALILVGDRPVGGDGFLNGDNS